MLTKVNDVLFRFGLLGGLWPILIAEERLKSWINHELLQKHIILLKITIAFVSLFSWFTNGKHKWDRLESKKTQLMFYLLTWIVFPL